MDIKLEEDLHDINIVDGDFKLTPDLPDSVKQKITIKVLTYKREWFLDQLEGIPYFESILGKGRSKETIDNIFKRAILQTEDVISLDSFESHIERTGRSYNMRFAVTVVGGDEAIPMELTI